MRTKETIEKLPEWAKVKLEALKETRQRIDTRNTKVIKEYKDMTRGYIACLLDSGIISQLDFRLLYIYYATM